MGRRLFRPGLTLQKLSGTSSIEPFARPLARRRFARAHERLAVLGTPNTSRSSRGIARVGLPQVRLRASYHATFCGRTFARAPALRISP